jgi:ATP-binding cassette subfamily B protein
MRHSSRSSAFPRDTPGQSSRDSHAWDTLNSLAPYLWQFKWRVLLAISCLIAAKLANVAVPLVFKEMIDILTND